MNENLRGICFPIVVTLLNLANINARSTKKIIIRLGTFFYGLIGGFLIYNAKTIPNEIRLQTVFEWVMLFSVGYYPFFELLLGKLYKSIDRHYEQKEKKRDSVLQKKIMHMQNQLQIILLLLEI